MMLSRIRMFAYWMICGLTASALILQIQRGSVLLRRASNVSLYHHETMVTDAALLLYADFNNSTAAVSDDVVSTQLPAALQPISFPSCCTQRSQDAKVLKDPWKLTCHTPQACVKNTLYPFQSEEERDFLQSYPYNSDSMTERRKTCKEAADRFNPEITWCKLNTSDTIASRSWAATKGVSFPESFYPTGCSSFSMSGGSGPYDRLLIFPSHKLAFCGIPKSGITRWIQFLRFTFGARDYQDSPYYKLDHMPFRFDVLLPDRQHQIWNDPEWTRAVLIREPTERLLSAYLDKIAPRVEGDHANLTLAEFVTLLEQPPGRHSGLTWYTDPHWRPQAYSCGMAQMLPSMDYVGGLDRVSEHVRNILSRVGLWESHGRHYRLTPKEARTTRVRIPPPDPMTVPATGFQQLSQSNSSDHHSRNAQDKLDQYYTPELLERVRKLYWMDYALWDALQQAGVDQHHGKDIAAILNPSECSDRQQRVD